jgi:hypothetical protein
MLCLPLLYNAIKGRNDASALYSNINTDSINAEPGKQLDYNTCKTKHVRHAHIMTCDMAQSHKHHDTANESLC